MEYIQKVFLGEVLRNKKRFVPLHSQTVRVDWEKETERCVAIAWQTRSEKSRNKVCFLGLRFRPLHPG